MNKKICSAILAFSITLSCIVWLPLKASAADDVKGKLDAYISAVSAYTKTPHWNTGRNIVKTDDLKKAVNQGNYTLGIESICCNGRSNNSTHTYNAFVPGDRGDRGCMSNEFDGAYQCMGFCKYLCYVLYNSNPTLKAPSAVRNTSTESGFTLYGKGATYPGLKTGDVIRYKYTYVTSKGTTATNEHAAIVYTVKSSGAIYVVDCNRGGDPCVVNLNKELPLIDEKEFKDLYNAGKAYVCRYGATGNSDTVLSGPVGKTSTPTVSVNGQNVTVSWNSVSNAQYYNVYLIQSPWAWKSIKYTGKATSTSYTFTNVTPGDYRAFVIARPNADSVQSPWASLFTVGSPAVNASLTLSKSSLTMDVFDSETLIATTTPAGQSVTWSSSSDAVAVLSDGTIFAQRAGTATVTAKMTYNGTTYSKTCTVTVKETSFTIPDTSKPSGTNASDKDSSGPSLSISGASSITQNTARVDASCSYIGMRPSSVGLCLGTSTSNLSKWGSDEINHNKNPFNIWYNLSGLSAGITYYYQFYAIVNGQAYDSEIRSFTTLAPQNLETGTNAWLERGSSGSDVKKMQKMLNVVMGTNLGLDGDFASRTESTLKSFQTTYGLYPDGVCGSKTWTELTKQYNDLLSAKPWLELGSNGRSVTTMQVMLNAVMGTNLGLDGNFAARTESVVRSFQTANGLSVDGACGAKTWTVLINQYNAL